MNARHRRLAVLLLVAACALALVARAARKREGALMDNRRFAARVVAGEFPYADRLHPPYPPSYGLVMAPLLLLPEVPSRIAWACLQLLFLWILWRLCMRWTQFAVLARPPTLAFLVALLLGSRFLLRDMKGGGGNLVFGVLVLLACLRPGEAPGEDRRPWTGCGLGLVLAAKPTPLLFLPWLCLRGRWRTSLVALATGALLHAAPLLTLGVDGYVRAYGQWLEGSWGFATQTDLFAVPAFDFPPFTWMNQALRYCLARFLGEVPHEHAAVVPGFFPGLGLGPEAVAWCVRAITATLLVATAVRVWRRGHELAQVGALIVLTLLLSPISWKAHHVQLLPVFFLLVAEGVAWWKLAAYFVPCVALSQEIVGDGLEEFFQSVYLVTFGAVWLWWECVTRAAPDPGRSPR